MDDEDEIVRMKYQVSNFHYEIFMDVFSKPEMIKVLGES